MKTRVILCVILLMYVFQTFIQHSVFIFKENNLIIWQFPLARSNCFFDLNMFKEIDLILFFLQVDLRHMCEVEGSNVVDLGIDLSEFYMSVEWDILEVPAVR